METKFVIRNTEGSYYTGTGFAAGREVAMPFETRKEAEKRTRLRSDWMVEEILVSPQPSAYLYENLLA